MWRFKAAAILGGILLIVFGVQESRLAAVAKPLARTMTCADLAARGPGDNAHISLREFIFGDNIVSETRKRRGATVGTTHWVPTFPLGDALAPEREIRVIVKTAWTVNSLEQIEANGKIDGLVINEIEKIDGETRSLLSRAYPGVKLDRCWIVEHGRKPASGAKLMGMIGGGGLLALLGLGWLIVGLKKG